MLNLFTFAAQVSGLSMRGRGTNKPRILMTIVFNVNIKHRTTQNRWPVEKTLDRKGTFLITSVVEMGESKQMFSFGDLAD